MTLPAAHPSLTRRDFAQAGAAIATAAASLSVNEGVELVAAADVNGRNCEKLWKTMRQAHPGKVAASDTSLVGLDGYKQLLDNPTIDVVLITSPPGFHPIHGRAAVAAGHGDRVRHAVSPASELRGRRRSDSQRRHRRRDRRHGPLLHDRHLVSLPDGRDERRRIPPTANSGTASASTTSIRATGSCRSRRGICPARRPTSATRSMAHMAPATSARPMPVRGSWIGPGRSCGR